MTSSRGLGSNEQGSIDPARGATPRSGILESVANWLACSRMGLAVMALVVGVAAGFGAVGFRELIFAFTWLATGYQKFGQQGHAPSLHLPWLGIFFVLVVPVVGGLIYGPLIQRFAREARGHGVPEVMVAVAENGGRIRPQVTVVKAFASALCIGVGGSVGREGPIVQVGSALASSFGQLVRMSESRLRIIVACGAAGGIAATFNAPITGVFFGFEIILREFSLDALFATILASVTADVISRAFFGSGAFFSAAPHGLSVHNDAIYLLIALLGLCAGLLGVGFKTFLYRLEDRVDSLWANRPEWARPAVGGVALGALLLALPQMYGVGYPVMDRALGGHYVLWFLAILMIGKVVAASLTLSIGGSGGVFAPSLFTGAAGGMAFGVIARHLFGPAVGPPALYGVVAMGGVFAAAQAPLTAIASVVEMTGNFGITLSIMLAAGIASAVSKRISYGSIYTTKLLRRGIDIERPKATNALRALRVSEVMQPVGGFDGRPEAIALGNGAPADHGGSQQRLAELVGPVTMVRQPQALFAEEDLAQALRQLILYGRDGLPVLSHDEHELRGWLTRANVISALDEQVGSAESEVEEGAEAAQFAVQDPATQVHVPKTPLKGYEIVEVTLGPGAPATGRRLGDVPWPPGYLAVAVTEGREIRPPRAEHELQAGDRVIVLAPASESEACQTSEGD